MRSNISIFRNINYLHSMIEGGTEEKRKKVIERHSREREIERKKERKNERKKERKKERRKKERQKERKKEERKKERKKEWERARLTLCKLSDRF
jgi:hypothetical protein